MALIKQHVMIEDIRKLKPGALIQIHDDLHYGTVGCQKYDGSKTKKDEVVLFLKLEKRMYESRTRNEAAHYYLHVIKDGQLVVIFFHSVTESTKGMPVDLEDTKYASYIISEVSVRL